MAHKKIWENSRVWDKTWTFYPILSPPRVYKNWHPQWPTSISKSSSSGFLGWSEKRALSRSGLSNSSRRSDRSRMSSRSGRTNRSRMSGRSGWFDRFSCARKYKRFVHMNLIEQFLRLDAIHEISSIIIWYIAQTFPPLNIDRKRLLHWSIVITI